MIENVPFYYKIFSYIIFSPFVLAQELYGIIWFWISALSVPLSLYLLVKVRKLKHERKTSIN